MPSTGPNNYNTQTLTRIKTGLVNMDVACTGETAAARSAVISHGGDTSLWTELVMDESATNSLLAICDRLDTLAYELHTDVDAWCAHDGIVYGQPVRSLELADICERAALFAGEARAIQSDQRALEFRQFILDTGKDIIAAAYAAGVYVGDFVTAAVGGVAAGALGEHWRIILIAAFALLVFVAFLFLRKAT